MTFHGLVNCFDAQNLTRRWFETSEPNIPERGEGGGDQVTKSWGHLSHRKANRFLLCK